MDPNNLIWMGWKWRHGDVSLHTGGDLAKRSGGSRRRPMSCHLTDLFFPLADCRAEQELIMGSELRTIATISGHLGLFAFEPAFAAQVDAHLRELLESAA